MKKKQGVGHLFKIIGSRLVCTDVEALLRTPEAVRQLEGVARLAHIAQTSKRKAK